MSTSEFDTVIAGEANESEDDMESEVTAASIKSVVVSGEASESDEDDDHAVTVPAADLPPLKLEKIEVDEVMTKKGTHVTTGSTTSATCDSLLHRKLREKNSAFHGHLEELVGRTYGDSAKELGTICQHLNKSQAAVQDISHNMRLLTNDLFNLEDKIDIVACCNLLPDINISPLMNTAQAAGSR